MEGVQLAMTSENGEDRKVAPSQASCSPISSILLLDPRVTTKTEEPAFHAFISVLSLVEKADLYQL